MQNLSNFQKRKLLLRIGTVIIVIFGILIICKMIFFLKCNKQPIPPINELSEMNGSECIDLFKEYGLVLPTEYQDDTELAEQDVEYILDEMQDTSSPSEIIAINRAGIHELADQIERILDLYGNTTTAEE